MPLELEPGDISEPIQLYDSGWITELYQNRTQAIKKLDAKSATILTHFVGYALAHKYDSSIMSAVDRPDIIHVDNFGIATVRTITNIGTAVAQAEIEDLFRSSSESSQINLSDKIGSLTWKIGYRTIELPPGWTYVLNNTADPRYDQNFRAHRAVNEYGRQILKQTWNIPSVKPRNISLPEQPIAISSAT